MIIVAYWVVPSYDQHTQILLAFQLCYLSDLQVSHPIRSGWVPCPGWFRKRGGCYSTRDLHMRGCRPFFQDSCWYARPWGVCGIINVPQGWTTCKIWHWRAAPAGPLQRGKASKQYVLRGRVETATLKARDVGMMKQAAWGCRREVNLAALEVETQWTGVRHRALVPQATATKNLTSAIVYSYTDSCARAAHMQSQLAGTFVLKLRSASASSQPQ